MTTSLRVDAHCPPDKEVVVEISNGDLPSQTKVLQDGESWEGVIWDPRTVTVSERLKE